MLTPVTPYQLVHVDMWTPRCPGHAGPWDRTSARCTREKENSLWNRPQTVVSRDSRPNWTRSHRVRDHSHERGFEICKIYKTRVELKTTWRSTRRTRYSDQAHRFHSRRGTALKNLRVLLGQQEVVPRPAFGRDERLTLTREAKVGVVLCGVHVHEEPLRRLIPRADLEAELEAPLALAPVALDEVVDAMLEDALELLDDALRAVLEQRGLVRVRVRVS